MAKVKIKQIKSGIKRLQNQKRTLEALGLRGIGKEVTHEATPNILGMIKKVEHLVSSCLTFSPPPLATCNHHPYATVGRRSCPITRMAL